MTRVLNHLRSNVVAYLALFVALGGTSYAAISLPAGSVGNRQLKNHSISPIKFDRGSIAGYVRDWAEIDPSGQLVASRPQAHLVSRLRLAHFRRDRQLGHSNPKGVHRHSEPGRGIPPVASARRNDPRARNAWPLRGRKGLLSAPTEVSVAVICPQP